MALSASRMSSNYISAVQALTAAGGDPMNMSQSIMTLLFQVIVDEIVANSELVPKTQDAGTAGAGIITGSVK